MTTTKSGVLLPLARYLAIDAFGDGRPLAQFGSVDDARREVRQWNIAADVVIVDRVERREIWGDDPTGSDD